MSSVFDYNPWLVLEQIGAGKVAKTAKVANEMEQPENFSQFSQISRSDVCTNEKIESLYGKDWEATLPRIPRYCRQYVSRPAMVEASFRVRIVEV